jgi:protein-L-isoaspartate O-methyltransferase
MPESWQEYADTLRGKLQDNGLMNTAELAAAFSRVPRHRHLDGFYEYSPDDFPRWRWSPAPARPEADSSWLDRVYQDRKLVIRLDENGNPAVSNTAPSLDFRMLGILGVGDGDRVLEIGTGTGQLTALLGWLVGGDGAVQSLEVDAELATAARDRLARLFPDAPVTVVDADALEWQPGPNRFDVLVATASCWPVPPGWLAGLAPGGRACLELRGNLGAALLRAQRSADDSADDSADERVTGTFTDDAALFIPLSVPGIGRPGMFEIPDWFGEDELDRVSADGLGYQQLLDLSFGWYCQLEIPDARLIGFTTTGNPAPEMFLISDYGLDAVKLPSEAKSADAHLVAYGGTSALLERLTIAWRHWQQHGRPPRSDYSFSADRGGVQRVLLRGGQRTWEINRESLFE